MIKDFISNCFCFDYMINKSIYYFLLLSFCISSLLNYFLCNSKYLTIVLLFLLISYVCYHIFYILKINWKEINNLEVRYLKVKNPSSVFSYDILDDNLQKIDYKTIVLKNTKNNIRKLNKLKENDIIKCIYNKEKEMIEVIIINDDNYIYIRK